MRLGGKRTILGALATPAACLLIGLLASGQAGGPEPPKPLLAEQVFKNIQVLRGIPVKEFMETMGFFSASLGANCTYCHSEESSGNLGKYAADIDSKQNAANMVLCNNHTHST